MPETNESKESVHQHKHDHLHHSSRREPQTDAAWCERIAALAENIADYPGGPQAIGVTTQDAAELAAASEAFIHALEEATCAATRSPHTVAIKDAARDRAQRAYRRCANVIRANFSISDEEKLNLGIRPTPRGPKKLLPAPSTRPVIWWEKSTANEAVLHYRDETTPDSRGRPYGTKALHLYSAISEEPITDPARLNFVDGFTRTPFRVPMPVVPAGSPRRVVTFGARWQGARCQLGPMSDLIFVPILGVSGGG